MSIRFEPDGTLPASNSPQGCYAMLVFRCGFAFDEFSLHVQLSKADHSLREKLRITFDPVPGGNGLAVVQAQVSSSRTAWLRFMQRMLTDRIDVFCQHRWRVMKLACDAEWPLTDNPVLALNYVRPGQYDFGAGWGKHNSNFIMPVSPRLAIFTQVGSKETGPWH